MSNHNICFNGEGLDVTGILHKTFYMSHFNLELKVETIANIARPEGGGGVFFSYSGVGFGVSVYL